MFGAIPAGNVFSFVPDISSAKGSDIIKLFDSIPDIDSESPEGKMVDVSKAQGRVHLDNIYFRYPTRPGVGVLHELSLQVEWNLVHTFASLVQVVPESTVIQLIERFYDPLAGEIYMDGVKIGPYVMSVANQVPKELGYRRPRSGLYTAKWLTA
ncbi:hypothetical protein BDZ89DRAFT_1150084 [Hymenopellis radicata]|nr:hypothetical protein BDZ89DRAFT_1150084 [Hymenopellis radicata]